MEVLTNSLVLERIKEKFGDKITAIHEPYELLTFNTDKETIIDLLKFLKNDSTLQFIFLTDLCGIHYPDQELQLGVIYHVHSFVNNIRIRIKVFLPIDNPTIPSTVPVYRAANWMERETYDFFGIIFEGHPNLKRILNVDDMEVFPMRKEFPLEDPNRIDKNDSYFGR